MHKHTHINIQINGFTKSSILELTAKWVTLIAESTESTLIQHTNIKTTVHVFTCFSFDTGYGLFTHTRSITFSF